MNDSNVKIRLYGPDDYKINDWSGGRTTQTAIFPENADYVKRDFLWRLSSATVETEESDFTRLPDFDRILMVLSGEVVLSYEGERIARLAELEQDRFDGAYRTKSFGKITDYNLMYRKGSMGYMEVVRPAAEKQIMRPELSPDTGSTAETAGSTDNAGPSGDDAVSANEKKYDRLSEGYYCKEGYAVVEVGSESRMVKAGQQLVIDGPVAGRPVLKLAGEGVLVRTQVYFREDEFASEEIPAEKATLSDFFAAMKIHLTGFRGSRYIFRSLREVWYDRELQRGIRKIEGLYLPVWVCLAGIIALSFICADDFAAQPGRAIGILAGWILLNMLVIWPFVYMTVLPKPIARHIKRIDSLSPYERKLYEEDCGRNERVERLLSKYKTQEELEEHVARKTDERRKR